MKLVVCLLILAGLILCAGCTTAPAVSPVPAVTPGLLGNWTGSTEGFTKGTGYRDYPWARITMTVTEQNGRFFSGHFTLPQMNGTIRYEGFAGVISPDGKSFHMVEYDTHEHDEGTILSENAIELVFIDDGDPQKIILDSLKRSS